MTETMNLFRGAAFREEETGGTCPQCGEAKRVRYVPVFAGAEMPIPMLCACERRQAAEKRARDTAEGYRLIREEARRLAGIPDDLRRLSLASLSPREGQTDAMAALEDFVGRWREDRHTPGVMLLGGTGRGKSFFATALANTIIDECPIDEPTALDCGQKGTVCDQHRRVPVRIAYFTETVKRMKDEMGAGGNPSRLEDSLKSAPVLIIDDLGAERLTEYVLEALFRIVDHRDRAQLPVIVTSNIVTPDGMIQRLGERTFSRLNGRCIPAKFTCGDQRGRSDAGANTADRPREPAARPAGRVPPLAEFRQSPEYGADQRGVQ